MHNSFHQTCSLCATVQGNTLENAEPGILVRTWDEHHRSDGASSTFMNKTTRTWAHLVNEFILIRNPPLPSITSNTAQCLPPLPLSLLDRVLDLFQRHAALFIASNSGYLLSGFPFYLLHISGAPRKRLLSLCNVYSSITISSDGQRSLISKRIGHWLKSSIFFFWRSRIYQNKPRTGLWNSAIARRWCKYGLGGCFRFSVVWSVCVVWAVCVQAERETALAWEEGEHASNYWYEMNSNVRIISFSLKQIVKGKGWIQHVWCSPFHFKKVSNRAEQIVRGESCILQYPFRAGQFLCIMWWLCSWAYDSLFKGWWI